MGYDLAASPLTDDELEEAAAEFGAPRGKGGWGFSDVMQDVLSREPKKIPVEDLSSLQQNLKDLGYLDPDYQTTGTWEPSAQAAFRRFERDNMESVQGGKHWLAAPVTTGLRTLGYVLPSSVMQGVIGAAKGIVEQAPETAERVGLLGGAASGALIGTAAAGPIGTAIGAGVGAVLGFAADFFGSEDEEEDQSLGARFFDALTPWEEYRAQGSKALWEDLGFVLTAASVVKGGSMAVKGVTNIARNVGTATAHGTPLSTALLAKQGVEAPGWMARISGAAIRPFSPQAAETWIATAQTRGLLAQSSRPLLNMANQGFSGLAAANVGARLSGGLGSGDDDPTTTKIENVTPIEEQILRAPNGPEVTLPGLGKVNLLDDTLGWVVFSNKFLPFEKGEIGTGAQTALTKPFKDMFSLHGGRAAKDYIESGTALKPYIHVAQEYDPALGRVRTMDEAKTAALRALGETPEEQIASDLWLRLDYGIYRRTGERMHGLGRDGLEFDTDSVMRDIQFDIKADIRKALDENDLDYINNLLAYSHTNPVDTRSGPMSFAGHLLGLGGIGSGLERMTELKEAHKILKTINSAVRTEDLPVNIAKGLEEFRDLAKPFKRHVTFSVREAGVKLRTYKNDAKKLRAKAAKEPLGSEKRNEMLDRADALDARYANLKENMPKAQKREAEHPFTITIARKYEAPSPADAAAGKAASGHHGYTTEQEALFLADEYDRQLQELTASFQSSRTSVDAMQTYEAKQREWNDFVQDLEWRGLVKNSADLKHAAPNKRVSDSIRKQADHQAPEVRFDQLPDDLAAKVGRLDEMGYKLIGTRDDILMFDEMDKVRETLKVSGVGDYTRRAAFFETIGLSPFKHSDRSLFALRIGHEEKELEQTFLENGIKLTGRQGLRKIHDKLVSVNHGDDVQTLGPGVIRKGDEALWKRISMYRVDDRELSDQHIIDALSLDKFDDLDVYDAAGKIRHALKKGAAMGGETNLHAPMDSVRMIGKAMRGNGMPGLSDFMRTFHTGQTKHGKAVAGAVAGATLGYYDDGWQGALVGGAAGGLAGASFNQLMKVQFPKGHGFYLTDTMHRLNMALRYSLSIVFDAGRYMEQNTLGMAHGLPAIFSPKKYITRHYGRDAWDEALDILDDINGTKGLMRIVDDTDRRQFQRGLLGFSPRHHEAAQAYLLKKRGLGSRQIEETISQIGRYGTGRTAAEKTINFVFFPFSFQKKLVTTLGDAVLQAPARALLLHEGIRRFQELEGDKKLAEFTEKHLPFVRQLQRLNNLAYGISPGRFMLEGVNDQRTGAGKAAQILTSFFVPSGAATPVAQAAGGLGDAAINLFTPLALTGEEMYGADDILNRYVPLVRDIDNLWQSGAEQVTALREGAAPYVQLQDYLDEKRMTKEDLTPIAMAMGYASVDGFFQSDAGAAFKTKYDQQVAELNEKYPTGFAMTNEWTNVAAENNQALYDIAQKPDRSEAEEEILKIAQMQNTYQTVSSMTGVEITGATAIRRRAYELSNNKRFVELWDRFFGGTFGPLSRIAA